MDCYQRFHTIKGLNIHIKKNGCHNSQTFTEMDYLRQFLDIIKAV